MKNAGIKKITNITFFEFMVITGIIITLLVITLSTVDPVRQRSQTSNERGKTEAETLLRGKK